MNAELGHDNNITLAGGRTARNWQQNFTLQSVTLSFQMAWWVRVGTIGHISDADKQTHSRDNGTTQHDNDQVTWLLQLAACHTQVANNCPRRHDAVDAVGNVQLLLTLWGQSHVVSGQWKHFFCNISPMNLLQLPDFSFTLKYKCYLIASIILLLRGLYQTAFMKAL